MDLLTANDKPGRHPDSYYAATARAMVEHPRIDGDIDCDVCIVGAGYTGLSAALHCAEQGLDVVVVEAHRAGWGASGRNGGQLGSGQRLDQERLEEMLGHQKARQLWDLAEEAKRLVHDLIEKHAIDCTYRAGIMYLDHRRRYVEDSRNYADKLRDEYGYEQIRFIDQDEVRALVASNSYYGGTLDIGAGHLHPLNYAIGLCRAAADAGARIFEHTKVVDIDTGDKTRIRTDRGAVRARFALLACNGYLGNLSPPVAERVMPINNFIIATEPLNDDQAHALIANNAAVADSRNVVNYYRLSEENRLLFGGGENYGYRFPADIKSFVRKYMLRVYPQLEDVRIDFGWGGTLGVTPNRMPYLVRLAPNLLSASGYSGHGIGTATLCGKLASEAIIGTASRFDLMASVPTPRFPGGTAMRTPLLALAMLYYSLRDRL
ncbi:NAD(P)/FAD-dependent oxidoreductase [Hoeflea sp. TYP-13]|uniref:NAD(P)/FAD-dependent oxidoreductase n=1 Tax=Hoeflea sp. TYP-13 TaxID=3230023 RepID=UPI0034C6592E